MFTVAQTQDGTDAETSEIPTGLLLQEFTAIIFDRRHNAKWKFSSFALSLGRLYLGADPHRGSLYFDKQAT